MMARARRRRRLSQKVELFLRSARAANTVRAYAADLRHFLAWGGRVPAAPNTVAEYLADLSATHRFASIARKKAAIAAAHRERGYDNPCASEVVRSVLKGVRRRIAKPPRQMRPLLWPQVWQLAQATDGTLAGVQAKAILLLGFAAALRRAELASLQIDDLGWRGEDLVIHLSRSKADQEGAGQEVTIANSRHGPVGEALLTWLRRSGVRSGSLFRRVTRSEVADKPLPAAAVTHLVKSRLKALGIDPGEFGAHSLRAGFVTSAALHGIPLWRIKRHTRHSRETMVETYVREEEGSPGLRLPWERAMKSSRSPRRR